VVGSGIMAQRLAIDPGIALLANTLATGGALVAILLVFGPISGAHLNPAVTLALAVKREVAPQLAVSYVAAQVAGGIAGAIAANAMFELPLVTWSEHARAGSSQLLSEAIATFGLLGVVVAVGRSRASAMPFAVAAYIIGAYWFTASTSFANPAVAIARVFSNTYAGIRPSDLAGFVVAQLAGAAVGSAFFTWLVHPIDRAQATGCTSSHSPAEL
jgi:glycerol uptake facilitator-like aquaporin